MGTFIDIHLDHDRLDAETSRKLVPACPVDIFALDGERVVVRPEQVDECILCRLCLEIAPPGAVAIYKLYSGEVLAAESAETPAE